MARTKGAGTLIKRGKYWTIRWVVDGVIHTQSTKCTNRKEAEDVAKEILKPYQAQSQIEKLKTIEAQIETIEDAAKTVDKGSQIKLAFMLESMLKDINQGSLTHNTRASYISIVNALTSFYPDKVYANEISKDDAIEFMGNQKAKLSEGSYNVRLNHIKHLWSVCMNQDKTIKINPFVDIKKIKGALISHRRELTEEEIKRLLETAKTVNEEVYITYLLGVNTGLRKSDIITLKWSNVDMDNRIIKVIPQKTKRNGKYACIPINDDLYDVLNKLERKDDYILPKLSKLKQQSAYAVIDSVFYKAGIKTKDYNGKIITGFHSLRHTFASNLHRSSIPLGQIQAILGHSTVDMSLKYTHTTLDDIKRSFDSVEVRINKDLYNRLMSLKKDDENFDDVIKKVVDFYFKSGQDKIDSGDYILV